MKKLQKLSILALSFIMVATSFVGCSQSENKTGGNNKSMLEDEIKNNKTFSFLFGGLSKDDATHPANKAIAKFTEETGKEIDFISCGYDEWNQKVNASLAANDPIDCVNAGVSQYPLFAMNGNSQPIDKFVNLKSESVDLTIMKKLLSYKDQIYSASPKNCSKPFVVYYNKTLFENDGIDTPTKLYQEGNWNYEKFKEIAMKYTSDSNNDGAVDKWGVACWYPSAFFGGSGASVCKISDEGTYELNIDNNQPLIEALELIQSAWAKDKWVGLDGDQINTSFFNQNNAMLCDYSWTEKEIVKAKKEGNVSFEYGVAPFPYGKANTEQVNRCFSDGFSILDGADAPYSAGKFIDILMDEYVKQNDIEMANLPAENVALYKKLLEKPFNNSYFDSAIDDASELCKSITTDGYDITKAIESLKPFYQSTIESVNKKAIKKATAKNESSPN